MGFKNISMNVWLISACDLQTFLIIKDDTNTAKPHVHTSFSKPLLEILPIYGNYFREKTIRKSAASCC